MGGGERVAIHSVKEALREGHEVYLATEKFDVDRFEDFFGVQGLFKDVRFFTYEPFRPLVKKAVLYQRLVYNQLRLRSILSKAPAFDLVLNTAEVANQPATRVASVQYCYFPEYFSHLESWTGNELWEAYYWPAKVFYHERVERIDRLLAVSNFTRGFVRQLWGRDSTTLYPPCPIDLYKHLPGPKEDLVITVGRISPEKRMDLFVQMARSLPEIKFAIIGSATVESESYLRRLRDAAPSNVAFVIAPLRKVRDMLGRAKLYVHCARNEHFGITIVEAMAAGCVPVVHDSGGPREIVTDDVGYRWTFPANAVSQISALVKDEISRTEMSDRCRSRAEMFRPEAFESGIGQILSGYAT